MSIGLGNAGLSIRAYINPHLWDNPDDPGGRAPKDYSEARWCFTVCCSSRAGGIRTVYD